METPVIIAARNEEENIGACLKSLAKQDGKIWPLVVVNGSTDKTADIATELGAYVVESEEGKIPAIQKGLRALGKAALGTVLILDADSRPIFRNWSRRMGRMVDNLPEEKPSIVWGPYIFADDINPIIGGFFTATSMAVSLAERHKEKPSTIRGGNKALKIKNSDLLEEMMNMENFWPRADVAIYDAVMGHGGAKKVDMHPHAWAVTSGARLSEGLKRIVKERTGAHASYDSSYATESPAESRPYPRD